MLMVKRERRGNVKVQKRSGSLSSVGGTYCEGVSSEAESRAFGHRASSGAVVLAQIVCSG